MLNNTCETALFSCAYRVPRNRALAAAALIVATLLGIRSAQAQPLNMACSRNCTPPPPASPGCYSDYAVTPVDDFRLEKENDVYASFYLDARNPDCARRAADRLESKLKEVFAYYGSLDSSAHKVLDGRSHTEVHPFRTWLAGSMVVHIFAAAKELDARGVAIDEALLDAVKNTYNGIPTPQDPGCGLRSLPWANSCMEDYALTATGYAWIAAYENARGRDPNPPEAPYATLAREAIGNALSPMSEHGGGPCFFWLERLEDGTSTPRCDGQYPEAKIIGADHNQENPNYGFGAMTGIATACSGLFLAGSTCGFNVDEKTIARELFRHAQEKAAPEGCEFNPAGATGCIDFTDPDGATKPCSDASFLPYSFGGYRPTDYPLKAFYEKRGIDGMYGPPYFQFDYYCESRTTFQPGDFWGPNRKVLYQVLAHDIFLPDVEPPSVTIMSIQEAADGTGAVTLTAHATDNLKVKAVEFRDGDILLGTLSRMPYMLTIAPGAGTHTLFARAVDDGGNVGLSAPVTVGVPTSGK